MYRLFSARTRGAVSRLLTSIDSWSSTGYVNQKRPQKNTQVEYQQLEARQVLSANFPVYVNGQLTLGDASAESPYLLADTFKLESNPTSKKTVYLDFTGHHSSDNSWKHSIQFPAYNTAGSDTTFHKSELIEIQEIFQNVAEDFLPLDVNVTTRYPGVEGLKRSSASDLEYGIRVVVTQQTGEFGKGTGGLAKRNSFVNSTDTPTFVFNKGVNNAAWTISHETGHTMGLTHDGHNDREYHPGVGSGLTSWGPIMGGPFRKNLTQWSDGSYSGATNRQDDLSVMTRSAMGIHLRADDVGNSLGAADSLKRTGDKIEDWGTITSRSDVDYYRFSVNDSELTISIKPFQGRGNLDVAAKLYSATGQLIATSNPDDSLSASFQQKLDKGTYYLAVDGVGLEGRYTDYGSLGFYSIEGEIRDVEQANEIDVNAVGESGNAVVNHVWQTVQLDKSYQDPVVVVGPATSNDASSGVVRIRNVTADSFDIRIEGWDDSELERGDESVGYLVVEAGKHDLADGRRMVAGNGYLSHRFRRIGFGEHFKSPPVVFGQVISGRGDATVKTRIEGVNTGSFGTLLEKNEAADATHPYERFSFLAIEQTGENSDTLAVGSNQNVADQARKIQLSNHLGTSSVFLAHTQTRNDKDPGSLRMNRTSSGEVEVFFQEEVSADREVDHAEEELGYLVLRSGLLRNATLQPTSNSSLDEVFGKEQFELDVAGANFAALDRFQANAKRG